MPKKYRIDFPKGKPIIVQPTLEDRLRFESTLRKNRGWGDLKDNALKIGPFLAWSAAERQGLTKLTWQEFTTGDTAAVDVTEFEDKPEDDENEVPGVGEGSETAPSNSSVSS